MVEKIHPNRQSPYVNFFDHRRSKGGRNFKKIKINSHGCWKLFQWSWLFSQFFLPEYGVGKPSVMGFLDHRSLAQPNSERIKRRKKKTYSRLPSSLFFLLLLPSSSFFFLLFLTSSSFFLILLSFSSAFFLPAGK